MKSPHSSSPILISNTPYVKNINCKVFLGYVRRGAERENKEKIASETVRGKTPLKRICLFSQLTKGEKGGKVEKKSLKEKE